MADQMMPNAIEPSCPSTSAVPAPPAGSFVTKVPVALAEVTVQINTEFPITFPAPVLEIKTIKKNLKLTQCLLALPSTKLFLSGFVRKNVQFATPITLSNGGVSSIIQSFTFDVPFSCVTDLAGKFIAAPILPKENTTSPFGFGTTTALPNAFPFTSTKESLMSTDLAEFDQVSNEFFNELPFCELISATFTEFDLAIGRTQGSVTFPTPTPTGTVPFEEGTTTMFLEKMSIDLTVKVLQNQQLVVLATPAPTPTP